MEWRVPNQMKRRGIRWNGRGPVKRGGGPDGTDRHTKWNGGTQDGTEEHKMERKVTRCNEEGPEGMERLEGTERDQME